MARPGYRAEDVVRVVRDLRAGYSVLDVVDFVRAAKFTADDVLMLIFHGVLGPWVEYRRREWLVRFARLATVMVPAVRCKMLRCVPNYAHALLFRSMVWVLDPLGFMSSAEHLELLGMVPGVVGVDVDAPEPSDESGGSR
jgi:hypothetical protein